MVRVECICCPQKSDVFHLPRPSARHSCCGSDMDQWAVNNGGDSGHLEEIDPRAFNNREEDSGLSMAHIFFNDASNSKLYPPSKKARKS